MLFTVDLWSFCLFFFFFPFSLWLHFTLSVVSSTPFSLYWLTCVILEVHLVSETPSSQGSVTLTQSTFFRVTGSRAHPDAFPRSHFLTAKPDLLSMSSSHVQNENRNGWDSEAGGRDKLVALPVPSMSCSILSKHFCMSTSKINFCFCEPAALKFNSAVCWWRFSL